MPKSRQKKIGKKKVSKKSKIEKPEVKEQAPEGKILRSKLQGVCRTCMRVSRCNKVKEYPNLSECPAHKIHGRTGKVSVLKIDKNIEL